MSNGKHYTEWENEATKQLSAINTKLDNLAKWISEHDADKKLLVARVESLEHSRTSALAHFTVLWTVFVGLIGIWLKKLFS